MQILAFHLNQIWEDKDGNINRIKTLLEEHSRGVDFQLIVFPEMTLTGFSVKNPEVGESWEANSSLEFFKSISVNYSAAVLFGMSVYGQDGKLYNRSFLIKDGQCLGHYDKNYIFSYAGEGDLYSPGFETFEFELDQCRIGLTTCFDLRFPELYREYRNCDLVINIANWPATRNHHWTRLLEARAIENQYFTLGVNRIGEDKNGLKYQMSPSFFGPLGESISGKVLGEECLLYSFEPSDVKSARNNFPFIKEWRKRPNA